MNVKKILCLIAFFSLPIALYGGKDKIIKIENGTSWTVICCAAFAGGAIVYNTYKYAFADNPLDEIRHAQKRIKGDVNLLNNKTDHLTQQVGAINQGVQKAQTTLDEHGNKLSVLDKRTQEITDHLLAIRKKQLEHSEQLQALNEQLKKMQEAGAQKSDVEKCETAIKELIEKQSKEFSASLDQLQTTHKVNTQSLKNELLQAHKEEFTDFEKRIAKLVVTEEFMSTCCNQLKQELAQTIREEFDQQRAAVGIDPNHVTFAQLKQMKLAKQQLKAS